jgi:murein DD-endopeptidase MepM/ murein hydrolase activator NlpD
MNIILVAKSHCAPRCIDLRSMRGRLLIAATLGSLFLLFAGIGFAVAVLTVNPRDAALRELVALRAQIQLQKQELGGVEENSRRDLDALAMQIGQLRAQATRLNALGDRLTQVGKLEGGEFDFGSEPALGGPEESLGGAAPLPVEDDIAGLRLEFERQEAQLTVLEDLLLDRKIDNALLPAGMPVAYGYIASGFGTRTDPISGRKAVHLGVDFDVPMGTRRARRRRGRGDLLRHPQRLWQRGRD